MQKLGLTPVILKGKSRLNIIFKIYNHLTGLYFFQKYVVSTILFNGVGFEPLGW